MTGSGTVMRLVPSGVHRPACDTWDEHLARSHRELGEFWENLGEFVDRVIFDWTEEQALAVVGEMHPGGAA